MSDWRDDHAIIQARIGYDEDATVDALARWHATASAFETDLTAANERITELETEILPAMREGWEKEREARRVAEDALAHIIAQVEAVPWNATPVEANVYSDDNRWCIHLWRGGKSADVFVPLAAARTALKEDGE